MPVVPIVPHRKTGVSCDGSIIPERDGEHVTLKCNTCGVVVGRVAAAILEAWEQAITDQIVIHKFSQAAQADGPDQADEREALAGISEFCQRGDCGQCPGHGDHEGRKIFCIHACDQVMNDEDRKESVN